MYDSIPRTTETVQIDIDRFTAAGKPTCLSWYGDSDSGREMCPCLILGVKQSYCGLTGARLFSYSDDLDFIKPYIDCPVWKDGV